MEIIAIKLNGRLGGEAFIDEKDFSLVENYTWNNTNNVAIACVGGGKNKSMQQVIMKPKPGHFVHHRNGNKLDNRRCNLFVTNAKRHTGDVAKKRNEFRKINAEDLPKASMELA